MNGLEVTCLFCHETQEYRGQEYCVKCKGRFSMWHLKRELGLNPPKPQVAVKVTSQGR